MQGNLILKRMLIALVLHSWKILQIRKKEELIYLRYPKGTETGDLIRRYQGEKFTSIPLDKRKYYPQNITR